MPCDVTVTYYTTPDADFKHSSDRCAIRNFLIWSFFQEEYPHGLGVPLPAVSWLRAALTGSVQTVSLQCFSATFLIQQQLRQNNARNASEVLM